MAFVRVQDVAQRDKFVIKIDYSLFINRFSEAVDINHENIPFFRSLKATLKILPQFCVDLLGCMIYGILVILQGVVDLVALPYLLAQIGYKATFKHIAIDLRNIMINILMAPIVYTLLYTALAVTILPVYCLQKAGVDIDFTIFFESAAKFHNALSQKLNWAFKTVLANLLLPMHYLKNIFCAKKVIANQYTVTQNLKEIKLAEMQQINLNKQPPNHVTPSLYPDCFACEEKKDEDPFFDPERPNVF